MQNLLSKATKMVLRNNTMSDLDQFKATFHHVAQPFTQFEYAGIIYLVVGSYIPWLAFNEDRHLYSYLRFTLDGRIKS